jgi:elongation factor Ts
MNITAADVNKLRNTTGAGMMDCKKALVEAEGDFEKAIEILRKKGQKVAANRSDRDATEGVVLAKASADNKRGTVVVLNCETDFVAKNDNFVAVANTILEIAMNNKPADLDSLKALPFADSGMSIADKITEEIGKIGEKLDLSYYASLDAESVFCYNHPGNKLASVVGFNKSTAEEVAKDVAMQAAAMAPIALDEASVTEETKQKEKEIAMDLAIQEGKPADMAEKIAMGRVAKFMKENTLLNQEYIKDSKMNVSQYMKSVDKDLTATGFIRFSLA